MTIGILDEEMGARGGDHYREKWRAELWRVRQPTTDEIEAADGNFGLEKIAAFDGGGDMDRGVMSVVRRESRIGKLKAAELAITAYNTYRLQRTKYEDERVFNGSSVMQDFGLALCCLSDDGFVTTHVSRCTRSV